MTPKVGRSCTGRGLGLAFCRLAGEAHGGRIWIEDGAPGAVFKVALPSTALSYFQSGAKFHVDVRSPTVRISAIGVPGVKGLLVFCSMKSARAVECEIARELRARAASRWAWRMRSSPPRAFFAPSCKGP